MNESEGKRSKTVQDPTPIDSGRTTGTATRSVSDDEVAALAYKLWEGRGCPIGSADEDWFRAEAELNNEKLTTPFTPSPAQSERQPMGEQEMNNVKSEIISLLAAVRRGEGAPRSTDAPEGLLRAP